LDKELEPNRKLFPDHLPFIFHGALVGAGSQALVHSGRVQGSTAKVINTK
jgi:hypothetical protein